MRCNKYYKITNSIKIKYKITMNHYKNMIYHINKKYQYIKYY